MAGKEKTVAALFRRRVAWRVAGAHLAVVFLVGVVPLMRGCFKKKPREIVTFIEFGAPAPQVEVETVSQMADPEPAAPAPDPEPAPIPEPAKPKPKPVPKPKPKPKVEKPKPKPKPKPEKPKWKPVDPKKIKIGKRVNETPSKPAVSEAEIKRALSGIASSSPASSAGNPSEFGAYDAQVFRIFHGAWTRPGTPGTRPAMVKISFLRNGHITRRVLKQGSGDPSFDQSVMAAVNSISMLPKPPAGYPDNIVVRFSVID
jgi:TonB family protein